MACGWGAGAARADIYVHVMNCTNFETTVAAYDAKDSVKLSAASVKGFSENQKGETAQLHCAGEGEGYCQMDIETTTAGCASADFHLDSGKWAVIRTVSASDGSCSVSVEKDLDAAPSSCD
jgi:hypothetical protein